MTTTSRKAKGTANASISKKRKRQSSDTGTKRPAPDSLAQVHSPQDTGHLKEGESVRECAKPYLLAVAEMPLDAFNTTWSIGRNRGLDPGHVRELKEMFTKVGIERRAPENRLIGLCSAEQVRRMRERSDSSQGVYAFSDWAETNAGIKVELMAGQHRIQALREYVKDMGSPEGAVLWWTCELYDKDRLPHDLNVKLRVNRRDPSLPDNHGQIWTQLVSVAHKGAGDRPEDRVGVDIKLVEALRLGGEKNFPTRRLVTLWNHTRWRDMVTRWCSTRLGLETFNISVFEWMSSLRIDDYWFGKLGAVLETLQALAPDDSNALGYRDWQHIASGLQHVSRTPETVESVFYKTSGGQRVRVEDLLPSLDNDQYAEVCRAISSNTHKLSFPDIKRLVRSSRLEAHVMARILQHVVAWIDLESALAIDQVNPKAKNKPLIRDNMAAALKSLARSRGAEDYPDDTSLRLQQRVLNLARDSLADFRAGEVRALLDDDVSLVRTPGYGTRFVYATWAQLLRLTRRITDSGSQAVLRPGWHTDHPKQQGGPQKPPSPLVKAFCVNVFKSVDRPELHTPNAMLAVQRKIEETIAAHMAEILAGRGGGSTGWQPKQPGGHSCPDDASVGSSSGPSSGHTSGDDASQPVNDRNRRQKRQASTSSQALSDDSGIERPGDVEDPGQSATQEGISRREQQAQAVQVRGSDLLPSSADQDTSGTKVRVPRWKEKRIQRAGGNRS